MKYLISLITLSVILAQVTDYSQTNYYLLNNTSSLNVTMENYEQLLWLVNISIGYPNQYFQVQFDTGSNILWVPSTSCKRCDIKTQYNPDGQASYNATGQTYTQYYGSGECSGVVATDTVALIGGPLNDTFLMMFATMEKDFAFTNVFDGIMGASNNQTFQNLFQVGYQSGQIDTELYAVALNQVPLTSYLLYGTIDSSLVDSAIWVIPDDIYRWKLYINAFVINGQDYTQYMDGITSAILDTGTSDLVVSADLYAILLEEFLYPAGCYHFYGLYCPCQPSGTALSSMPNITIAFNQVNVTIPFMNLLQYYYNSTVNDTCSVSLSYVSDSSFMVFGDPALLSFIPVFNKTANQIGIIGGVANGIPNGNYTGDDELDEIY